jgi:hypothetical protein
MFFCNQQYHIFCQGHGNVTFFARAWKSKTKINKKFLIMPKDFDKLMMFISAIPCHNKVSQIPGLINKPFKERQPVWEVFLLRHFFLFLFPPSFPPICLNQVGKGGRL